MSVAQQFAAGLITIGILSAVLLPGRQTVPVINAGRKLVTGSLHTAETGQN